MIDQIEEYYEGRLSEIDGKLRTYAEVMDQLRHGTPEGGALCVDSIQEQIDRTSRLRKNHALQRQMHVMLDMIEELDLKYVLLQLRRDSLEREYAKVRERCMDSTLDLKGAMAPFFVDGEVPDYE